MANRTSHQENLQIAIASAIAILAIGLVLGSVLVHEVDVAVAQTNFIPLIPTTLSTTSIGAPVQLLIPSLNVKADIEQVGLTKAGSMDVPTDPMNVGWYATGPHPGAVGSAVMDGHVNWWGGKTGVFKRLHLLEPGAKIMVADETGAIITFVVSHVKSYDAAANATDIFTSQDGLAHLNLITCSGAWNTAEQQYNDRLVIFADKINN